MVSSRLLQELAPWLTESEHSGGQAGAVTLGRGEAWGQLRKTRGLEVAVIRLSLRLTLRENESSDFDPKFFRFLNAGKQNTQTLQNTVQANYRPASWRLPSYLSFLTPGGGCTSSRR